MSARSVEAIDACRDPRRYCGMCGSSMIEAIYCEICGAKRSAWNPQNGFQNNQESSVQSVTESPRATPISSVEVGSLVSRETSSSRPIISERLRLTAPSNRARTSSRASTTPPPTLALAIHLSRKVIRTSSWKNRAQWVTTEDSHVIKISNKKETIDNHLDTLLTKLFRAMPWNHEDIKDFNLPVSTWRTDDWHWAKRDPAQKGNGLPQLNKFDGKEKLLSEWFDGYQTRDELTIVYLALRQRPQSLPQSSAKILPQVNEVPQIIDISDTGHQFEVEKPTLQKPCATEIVQKEQDLYELSDDSSDLPNLPGRAPGRTRQAPTPKAIEESTTVPTANATSRRCKSTSQKRARSDSSAEPRRSWKKESLRRGTRKDYRALNK